MPGGIDILKQENILLREKIKSLQLKSIHKLLINLVFKENNNSDNSTNVEIQVEDSEKQQLLIDLKIKTENVILFSININRFWN